MKHPNFDLMYNISFFSQFVFDEFIVKGEILCIKLDELLLIEWLREETW
jgi:hypothetical protein